MGTFKYVYELTEFTRLFLVWPGSEANWMVKVRIGIGGVGHIQDINCGGFCADCVLGKLCIYLYSSSLQGIAELPVCPPTSRVFAQLTLGADSWNLLQRRLSLLLGRGVGATWALWGGRSGSRAGSCRGFVWGGLQEPGWHWPALGMISCMATHTSYKDKQCWLLELVFYSPLQFLITPALLDHVVLMLTWSLPNCHTIYGDDSCKVDALHWLWCINLQVTFPPKLVSQLLLLQHTWTTVGVLLPLTQ